MKLYDPTTHRFLGIPADFSGLTNPAARLGAFEPENPKLLVPRAAGIGWDFNIGAIASRLGLIRPDDSLPDLEAHIPATTIAVLRGAPWTLLALNTAAALPAIKDGRPLPQKWSATFAPKKWTSPARAMLSSILPAAAVAGFAEWTTRRDNKLDVTGSLLATSLGAMSLLLTLAARQAADAPATARALSAAGTLALPVVEVAGFVAVIKSALAQVDRELKRPASSVAAA
ncbi:DUF5808 domain-containing protein [uncultured Corynebacterium sp.]|uniref:DUF5808 domain-containing protein n=1 Tax=uncultured Corynebacterium sp. TaxID=159447 RepID=UPI002595B0BB|nr:DUF5808 domain-containing protein [uncultured Corynebacterium sp.]